MRFGEEGHNRPNDMDTLYEMFDLERPEPPTHYSTTLQDIFFFFLSLSWSLEERFDLSTLLRATGVRIACTPTSGTSPLRSPRRKKTWIRHANRLKMRFGEEGHNRPNDMDTLYEMFDLERPEPPTHYSTTLQDIFFFFLSLSWSLEERFDLSTLLRATGVRIACTPTSGTSPLRSPRRKKTWIRHANRLKMRFGEEGHNRPNDMDTLYEMFDLERPQPPTHYSTTLQDIFFFFLSLSWCLEERFDLSTLLRATGVRIACTPTSGTSPLRSPRRKKTWIRHANRLKMRFGEEGHNRPNDMDTLYEMFDLERPQPSTHYSTTLQDIFFFFFLSLSWCLEERFDLSTLLRATGVRIA
ncbi:hypothetical protein Y032_0131g1576 [Ancylostoma ceylanicum]|uniref:Uncharacterized protein n=1 Tax=Ancylostoma ceylanicum TaxID=53326 RepID=A0A016T6Y1_9BILA|nr:hypothetical protein Y032_0131g1576 [Ancylostoma ceylanicum]